ncbi:MAG: cyclic nucleotide-binding domain-containing protein, partial [Chitinophagaceae bacterium]
MPPKEILRTHINRVISLTDDQFEDLIERFTHKSYKKGQAIITQGATVENEFFVLDGYLKTFYINDDFKMFILQFAMPGWWASDYNALYSGSKATVGVDCITDSEVLCISNTDREKLCRDIPAVEYFFRWRTNKGYVALQK